MAEKVVSTESQAVKCLDQAPPLGVVDYDAQVQTRSPLGRTAAHPSAPTVVPGTLSPPLCTKTGVLPGSSGRVDLV